MVGLSFKLRRNICSLSLILFLLALFAVPSHAADISLDEYQRNLQKAITALDTLGQVDEGESPDAYSHRLAETISGVRNTIPEKQKVDSDGIPYEVDNTSIHKNLHELESASEKNRDNIRIELIEALKSIEERVGDVKKAKATRVSKEEANKKLSEILSRSEYESKEPKGNALINLLVRFLTWLSKFLPRSSRLASSHGSPLTVVAQILVLSLAAAVLLYAIIKLLKYLRGRGSVTSKAKSKKEPRIVLGERLEPEASAADLLSEAEALARGGEIRAAIRKTYIALLVELGDRKIISLAQHKTNRDYLRSVSNLPSLYKNMSGLTDSFELHWYGFAQTSAADWQNFRDSYLAALRTND